MNYKSFAERTKNKTFDELVHEGKRRAHELIELNAQVRFREWCIERGINPDEISEEQVMELIDKVVHEARKRKWRLERCSIPRS